MGPPDSLTPAPAPAPAGSTRLLLTVWVGDGNAWHARAEWGEQHQAAFDSPFELARFMAQLPLPPLRCRGLR